jgi:flagellar hook-associated protein 1 FlgK
MSLGVALNTAVTGLNAVQSALQIASNNVSNANTEGFTRKTVDTLPLLLSGAGVGVSLSNISRQVNDVLIRDMRNQLAEIGALKVNDEYFTRTQDLFGTLDSNTSLTAAITDFGTAVQALEGSPDEPALQQQVIAKAEALTRQFNSVAKDVQTMRADADKSITDSITVVNTQLKNIQELNESIARASAIGDPTANLLDERDKAVATLAEHMQITTYTRPTGEIVIMTKGGRTLLDGSAPTLTHTPAAAVDASVTYGGGGFDGIMLNGTDITSELTSGKIGALIAMRDTTLPNLGSEVDNLATKIFDEVNAIHNDGAAYPPPNSLTGTQTVAAGDAFAGTGTFNLAVVDSSGLLVAPPISIDVSTYATVGAVVTALNTALGANGTAAIVGGKVVVTATGASNGIVIDEGDTAIGANNRGFSHYFGLNDFFVGDTSTNLAANMSVNPAVGATPTHISRGGLDPAAAAAGDVALTVGDNTVIQRIAAKFDEALSFGASGELGALTVTMDNYASQILSVNAAQSADATSTLNYKQGLFDDIKYRADSASGVNIDEEMASIVQLQNNFGAIARVISVTQQLMQVLVDAVQ